MGKISALHSFLQGACHGDDGGDNGDDHHHHLDQILKISDETFYFSLRTAVENGHEEESQVRCILTVPGVPSYFRGVFAFFTAQSQQQVPAKMVHYMTDKYNDPLYKVGNNTFII